jgi:hypothetical protein
MSLSLDSKSSDSKGGLDADVGGSDVTLLSSESEKVVISRKVAMMSELLKTIIENGKLKEGNNLLLLTDPDSPLPINHFINIPTLKYSHSLRRWEG